MKRYLDKRNRRLVYIGKKATPDFWDHHWNVKNFRESVERGKKDILLLKTMSKYLPDKKGKILDGGCGISQKIYCMFIHRYKAIGVDFAKKTIKRVKEVFPELDVRLGDVRNLLFPDNTFVGYWSVGVIEHFWEGYGVILKEMRRVLIPGGYLFLSFPYMSPLRRLKAKIGLYSEFNSEGKDDFFQFALNEKAVITDFKTIGFKLLEKNPISTIKGFIDEVSSFKYILQKLLDYKGKNKWVRGFRFMLRKVLSYLGTGHSVFLVFKNIKLSLEDNMI